MQVSRRAFLKMVSAAAATLGLSSLDLLRVTEALANTGHPPVLWLQGAVCTGCTISLLNTTSPGIDEVLTSTISLEYHPNLTTRAGELAIASLAKAAEAYKGEFILCIEGGIPANLNGNYAIIGEVAGRPVTMLEAVNALGPRAKYVVAVGTCAAFGGVPKLSQATGITTVQALLTGKTQNPVINLSACPVNPITLLGTLVHLLTGGVPELDRFGRPLKYYNTSVHHICPRLPTPMVQQIGVFGCYEHVGCKGPHTAFTCPNLKWNNGVNWCIDTTNTVCIGCSAPNFPQTPFYTKDMTCCTSCEMCKTCVDCSMCANITECGSCVDCSNCSMCLECAKTVECAACVSSAVCAACARNMNCPCYTGGTTATSGSSSAPSTM